MNGYCRNMQSLSAVPVSFLSEHHRMVLLTYQVMLTARSISAFTLGACDGNPCMNGGQCVDMGTEANPKQFTCACAEGYTGKTCQKRIHPCAEEPCQNGGICEPRGEHFHCSCSERFKGKLCEQYMRKRNPCHGDPCGAHGFCEVVNYEFVCECSPGYHGSRCEFEEEPIPEEDDEEVEVVPVETKAEAQTKSALVIGEVVLILFCIFIFVLIVLCIHWVRVSNARSKHDALQKMKMVAGQEVEPKRGWFETSNDLCFDFWCYCCRVVNKYENERSKYAAQGELEANGFCHGNPLPTSASHPSMDRLAISRPSMTRNAPSHHENFTFAGSHGHLPISSSRQLHRSGSRLDHGGASNNQSSDFECCQEVNLGHHARGSDRQKLPVYLTPEPGRRTPRGSMPGFRPCPHNFQTNDTVPRGNTSANAKKLRVRRYGIPRGRSNKPIIGNLNDDGDDDNIDTDDEDSKCDIKIRDINCHGFNDGPVVGPAGSLLPVQFQRGVQREESVDQLYFNNNGDTQSYNESNSLNLSRRHNSSRLKEQPENIVTGRQGGILRAHPHSERQNLYEDASHRNSGYIYNDTGESQSIDGDNDSDDDHQRKSGLKLGELGNYRDNQYHDEEDYSGGSENEDAAPRRSYRPSRRLRQQRGSFYNAADDDGYSSTGRLSESDAGGRSRDPLSVQGVTQQARRNYDGRQESCHSRVPRRELAASRTRGDAPYPHSGIRFSPHPAPTPPFPNYNKAAALSARGSSPFTAAPHPDQSQMRTSPFYLQQSPNHYQLNNPPHSLQLGSQSQTPYHNQAGHHTSNLTQSPFVRHAFKRPRSSFAGWEQTRAARQGYEKQSQQSTFQFSPLPTQPIPPVRKPRVKGILKKTSSYGGNYCNSALDYVCLAETKRNAYNGRVTPSYLYEDESIHLIDDLPPYPPPAYDEFIL